MSLLCLGWVVLQAVLLCGRGECKIAGRIGKRTAVLQLVLLACQLLCYLGFPCVLGTNNSGIRSLYVSWRAQSFGLKEVDYLLAWGAMKACDCFDHCLVVNGYCHIF